MYGTDQRWPRIIVSINSGCACMSAINCGWVGMSGDQWLPQNVCWGTMVATHVSSSMVVANTNYVLSSIA